MTLAPLLSWYSPMVCWDYWGGCDPSALDAALRALAGAFGYGPDAGAVTLFLLFLATFPTWAVLRDPLADDLTQLGKQLTGGLLLVAVPGHGATVGAFALDVLASALGGLASALAGLSLPWGELLAAAGMGALGLLAGVVLQRSRRLVANLRGGPA